MEGYVAATAHASMVDAAGERDAMRVGYYSWR